MRAAAAAGVERSTRAERACWLPALADAVELHRDELVALAHDETHLSEARLDGEVVRTATQLRFFAGVDRGGLVPRGDARLARRVARAAAGPTCGGCCDRSASRRGVRRVELPVRVLGARQRHRLGARRRLPGRREGAPRASAPLAGKQGSKGALMKRPLVDSRRTSPPDRRSSGRAASGARR